MADQEQLGRLKEGIEPWNKWRHDNPGLSVDLIEANLSEAHLRGADLRGADLSRAPLSGADLRGADLRVAQLSGADLRVAHLSGADLRVAHLSGADLRGADLSGAHLSLADLRGANLSVADLRGANLSGAIFYGTIFGNTNLQDAQGLHECHHLGPSIVDHRTLAKSGPLPLAFLRGCGLPDELIEYLPSILNKPLRFYSCFISYSTKDRDFAERLHADLQNKGVRCWFAPEDIKIGEKFRSRIDESIRVFDKLLLILSKRSIASSRVEDEVEAALERESRENRIVLFPIRIDNAIMQTDVAWASHLRQKRHIGDFRGWKQHDEHQKAFERLLRDLQATVQATEAAGVKAAAKKTADN